MSGLEIVGGIGAVVGIIGSSIQLYNKAKRDKKLPEECNAIQLQLPLISDILQTCKEDLRPRENSLSPETKTYLHKIIRHCDKTANQLSTESDDILSSNSLLPSWTRGKPSRKDRVKKLKELMAVLAQNVNLIVTHRDVKTATPEQSYSLRVLLEDLGCPPPQSTEKPPGQQVSSGVGAQNDNWNSNVNSTVNSSDGYQIIGNVSGQVGGKHKYGSHADITSSTITNSKITNNIRSVSTREVDFSFHKPFDIQIGQVSSLSSELFVGRGSEIDQIAQTLHSDNSSKERKCVVLSGMGGVGKTQLAIKYVKSRRGAYSSVFWLNAASEDNVKESFRSIGGIISKSERLGKLPDEKIVRGVHQWLSEPANSRWLLVFDNYDEPDKFRIENHFPSASFGAILVTSRRSIEGLGKNIDIKPVKEHEGLAILRARSQRESALRDTHARSLAKRLDGLPLALATAGAYLHKSRISFKDYLAEYEEHWSTGLKSHPGLREYQDRTLYTTWKLSYGHLKKQEPIAAEMLRLLAYFDNQSFSRETFVDVKSCPGWLSGWIKSPVKFSQLTGALTDYNFLDVHPKGRSWSLHNCLHDWTLAALNQRVAEGYYWYSVDCLGAVLDWDDRSTWATLTFSHSARHALRLLHQRFLGIFDGHALTRFETLNKIGLLLSQQDYQDQAEKVYKRTLSACKNAPETDDNLILTVMNNLGNLYLDFERPLEAEQMLMEVLRRCENTPEADVIVAIRAMYTLGRLYLEQENLEKAKKRLWKAASALKKLPDPDLALVLGVMTDLGDLYRKKGRLPKAEDMLVRALRECMKKARPGDLQMLGAMNHLGRLYLDDGKLPEAEQMFQQALAGCDQALRRDHPMTLEIAHNLELVYSKDRHRLGKGKKTY